jgi:hypothetical protein
MIMLRKFGLGLVAASALIIGTAGMTSTASARGGHGGHHGGGGHWHGGGGHWHGGGWGHRGWGPRFYGGPYYYGGYGGCYVRRLVPTPWGPRWRLINRCY